MKYVDGIGKGDPANDATADRLRKKEKSESERRGARRVKGACQWKEKDPFNKDHLKKWKKFKE